MDMTVSLAEAEGERVEVDAGLLHAEESEAATALHNAALRGRVSNAEDHMASMATELRALRAQAESDALARELAEVALMAAQEECDSARRQMGEGQLVQLVQMESLQQGQDALNSSTREREQLQLSLEAMTSEMRALTESSNLSSSEKDRIAHAAETEARSAAEQRSKLVQALGRWESQAVMAQHRLEVAEGGVRRLESQVQAAEQAAGDGARLHDETLRGHQQLETSMASLIAAKSEVEQQLTRERAQHAKATDKLSAQVASLQDMVHHLRCSLDTITGTVNPLELTKLLQCQDDSAEVMLWLSGLTQRIPSPVKFPAATEVVPADQSPDPNSPSGKCREETGQAGEQHALLQLHHVQTVHHVHRVRHGLMGDMMKAEDLAHSAAETSRHIEPLGSGKPAAGELLAGSPSIESSVGTAAADALMVSKMDPKALCLFCFKFWQQMSSRTRQRGHVPRKIGLSSAKSEKEVQGMERFMNGRMEIHVREGQIEKSDMNDILDAQLCAEEEDGEDDELLSALTEEVLQLQKRVSTRPKHQRLR